METATEDGMTESSRASTPAPVEEVSEVGRSSRFKMAHDAQAKKLVPDAVEAEEMRVVDAAMDKEEAVSILPVWKRASPDVFVVARVEAER